MSPAQNGIRTRSPLGGTAAQPARGPQSKRPIPGAARLAGDADARPPSMGWRGGSMLLEVDSLPKSHGTLPRPTGGRRNLWHQHGGVARPGACSASMFRRLQSCGCTLDLAPGFMSPAAMCTSSDTATAPASSSGAVHRRHARVGADHPTRCSDGIVLAGYGTAPLRCFPTSGRCPSYCMLVQQDIRHCRVRRRRSRTTGSELRSGRSAAGSGPTGLDPGGMWGWEPQEPA